MQIQNHKKVLIGMILITLFMSLSVLNAENPDNISSDQITSQDINNYDNSIDQGTISTNINKEIKQSSNSIKKKYFSYNK